MNDVFWTRFFVIAGAFNILVGLPMVIDPGLVPSPIALPKDYWLFVRIAGACVAAFGAGYLMVASNLDRHRGIVVIGALGKTAVFLIFLIYWLKGTIGFWAFSAGAIDIVWAVFFIAFLRRYPAR